MSQTRSSHQDEEAIGKIVGRRKMRPATHEDADRLLRTAWAMRGNDRLVPRGVYRFETFEEADRWMIRMMARTHALRPSKTSRASAAHSTKREPATS